MTKRERQQNLFRSKGAFYSLRTMLDGLAYNVCLTPALRDKALLAYLHIKEACEMFNKEVGWKEEKDESTRIKG